MDWLRLYSEARNDAKLRSLTDGQFRVWFNLLCLAGEQVERGTIRYDDDELLALEVANADAELLADAISRLTRLRIIECESRDVTPCHALRFVKWRDRQYDKPSDAPERTRERKRVQRERERDGADPSFISVPDVTPLSRDVTPHSRSRAEAEQIQKQSRAASATPDWALRAFAAALDRTATGDDAVSLAKWAVKLGPGDEDRLRRALLKAHRKAPDSLFALARTCFGDPPDASTDPIRVTVLPDSEALVEDMRRRGPMTPNGKRANDP